MFLLINKHAHASQKQGGHETLDTSSFGVKPFDAGKKGNKPEENHPREEMVKPSVSSLRQTRESSKE
jgi:hypothetical protein